MSSKSKIIALTLSSISVLSVGAVSTALNNQSSVNSSYSSYNTKNEVEVPTEPVVEVKTETKTISIPYSTTTVKDSSRAKGTSYVKTQGKDGKKVETYRVIYSDGVEIDRRLISAKTVSQPVNKVVAEGTYVKTKVTCPNGSYVNTYGNVVCRPASTNTGTATARCRDGSYSYSRTRRGTCSHHGGVLVWL